MKKLKQCPLLCADAEILALLEGRKTQVRTPVDPQPRPGHEIVMEFGQWLPRYMTPLGPMMWVADGEFNPPGQRGDILWVKEAWSRREDVDPSRERSKAIHYMRYRADGGDLDMEWHRYDGWKSASSMPRWASRISLAITDVRAELLQDISPRDAWSEGAQCSCTSPVPMCKGNIESFAALWDRRHGKKHPWESNPWVWIREFKVVMKVEATT